MSHDHAEIDKHVRQYMMVFAALVVLTFITVGASYLHLPAGPALALGLLIATVKASLVAAVFMHLSSEKKLIYIVMAIAVVFFFFELLIPVITESNNLHMGG